MSKVFPLAFLVDYLVGPNAIAQPSRLAR